MMEELLKKYESLSDVQKKALIIYKSNLGKLINDLDNNPDYLSYFEKYKEILDNPYNLFIKKAVFSIIDFSTLDNFISSISEVKNILLSILNVMEVSEDITLYRAVSTDENINDIAKGKIISTSLSFGESLKFADVGQNLNIYQIHLKKGDKVLYNPYALLYNKVTGQLYIDKNRSQEELILDKDLYDFEIIDDYKMDDNIRIIDCVVSIKEAQKNRN